MDGEIAFIGFGEAGQAFAGARRAARARAYDIKTAAAATCEAKRADYARAGVDGHDTPAAALAGAAIVLSVVTADQALPAARLYAGLLAPGASWFDLNSVAPGTKRDAAVAIEAAGGRYVDVAVMAPVHPLGLAVPLLVSGPHAEDGAAALTAIGFSNVRVVAGGIGAASAIKMIRSVMVKGLEALTTEWILAAEAAGVRDEAVAALNASWPGTDWAAKADYNLDRMMVHGRRRAEEMYEAAATLKGLGISPMMTEAVVNWQQAIGDLGIDPPAGLTAKLAAIGRFMKDEAA